MSILIVLLILNVSKVLGNCGQPASHPELWIYGSIGVAEEGHRLQFECRDDLWTKFGGARLTYTTERICTRGKWSPRMPKCGLLVFFYLYHFYCFNFHVSYQN